MEFTACDNKECIKHLDCKRFKMFTMGATDAKTNGGSAEQGCRKYLPLKEIK